MTARRYGWKLQEPDHRDWRFATPAAVVPLLPPKVDLRPADFPVYDQGRIGSCTANAIAGALQFCMLKEGKPSFVPSRLFIYWNERNAEGTVSRDAGAVIRDGIKVVNTVGACPERNWSYDDTPADAATGVWAADAKPRAKPNCLAYRYAAKTEAVAYLAVLPQIDQIKACLAQGFPIVFGFTVFDGFESEAVARTGVLEMPQPGERNLGGHAVLAMGYDDATRRLLVRNSWGATWGTSGYFTMPYEYAAGPANLASDFWTIRAV